MKRSSSVLGLVCALGMLLPAPAVSQSMEGAGIVPTGLSLRQMDGVKRVLMIGAHPDDEDTGLLTVLARGMGAETAYLSLTRGDGGQNLIGSELWEGLGVIRTGELEGARSLDGGLQFFTRAFDYGYSKTAEEALRFWPREELLRDVTWVVRTFRPHVIVSVFSGTPRDGHGQHQAAGIMAQEVFAAAGDPERFPDQIEMGLEAWAPDKLYQSSRRRFFGGGPGSAGDGSMVVQIGDFDPLLGRSLFQLSMESRSQHRSQDMGAPQSLGPRNTGVVLVESRVGGEDGGIFAGVDTTLVGILSGMGPEAVEVAGPHLEAYRTSVRRAQDGLGLDPGTVVPHLAEAFEHLVQARRAIGAAADREFEVAMDRKQEVATNALMAASGIVFDLRSMDDLVVPGQTVPIVAQLWNGGETTLITPGIQIFSRDGWEIEWAGMDGLGADGEVAPGTMATWSYDVTVPEDADPSRLYFLQERRDGAFYQWPQSPGLWGLPRDPAPIEAAVTFRQAIDGSQEGTRVVSNREWRYVGVDPAFGEFEKEVLVVPGVSVNVSPRGIAWPQGDAAAKTVTVVVGSEAEGGASGTVTLNGPSGWAISPASHDFQLDIAGAERTLSFEVRPDGTAPAGEHVFTAVATTADGTFTEGVSLIDYDHVPRTAMYADAEATVTVIPVDVPAGLTVGYIMGSGDTGPEAIRQMGVGVTILDEAAVREGDFGRFDAVVLGIRAYESRPDLQAASGQLLDFARSGGTVIVQYNRGPLGALAPFEMEVGRGSPRVSDETAQVRMIDPSSPVFTTPNRITDEDFDGWVQERGLYFASEWDDRYIPLLSLNDPGEPERLGSLLVAPVGDGVFVYSALSFFRQWADRVPGAYRLFANLISLDGADF